MKLRLIMKPSATPDQVRRLKAQVESALQRPMPLVSTSSATLQRADQESALERRYVGGKINHPEIGSIILELPLRRSEGDVVLKLIAKSAIVDEILETWDESRKDFAMHLAENMDQLCR